MICPECEYPLYDTGCPRSPECAGYGCQLCGHGCDYGLVSDTKSVCVALSELT